MIPTIERPGLAPTKAIQLRDQACSLLGVTAETLWRRSQSGGFNRSDELADRRGLVYLFIWSWKGDGIGFSSPEVARACGVPNHSTVLSSIKRLEARGLKPLQENSECL